MVTVGDSVDVSRRNRRESLSVALMPWFLVLAGLAAILSAYLASPHYAGRVVWALTVSGIAMLLAGSVWRRERLRVELLAFLLVGGTALVAFAYFTSPDYAPGLVWTAGACGLLMVLLGSVAADVWETWFLFLFGFLGLLLGLLLALFTSPAYPLAYVWGLLAASGLMVAVGILWSRVREGGKEDPRVGG